MRSPVAVLALAVALGACGDAADPGTLRTPPDRSSAQPLARVARAERRAERALHVHLTRRDAQRVRPVLRGWGEALRRDRTGRAARYFALPAIVAQGSLDVLETRADLRDFIARQRCGARLLRVRGDGRFVVGTFVLTRRPEHSCGERGRRVRIAFVLRGRKISEWRMVPKGARTPGPARPETAPDPPLPDVS